MQEDVLGTRQTVVGERYDLCTRCGQPMPREQATIAHQVGEGPRLPLGGQAEVHPLETTQDAPPPLLCADCARQVADGEPLEPLDDIDRDEPSGIEL